jgi:hypothetical protein
VKTQTTDTTAEGFTILLTAWPDIGLMEFSRQAAYIGSIFGVPLEELDRLLITEGQNLGEWQSEIRTQALMEVNNVLKIFKK